MTLRFRTELLYFTGQGTLGTEAAMAARKRVDTTLVVLREIRDAVQATNARVGALATDVSTMQRQHLESEIRLATAITDMHATTKDLAALIRETRAAERLASLEQRLREVERKVG